MATLTEFVVTFINKDNIEMRFACRTAQQAIYAASQQAKEGWYVSGSIERPRSTYALDGVELNAAEEPPEPMNVYHCDKCGCEVTAAEADDNGGKCAECATLEA